MKKSKTVTSEAIVQWLPWDVAEEEQAMTTATVNTASLRDSKMSEYLLLK